MIDFYKKYGYCIIPKKTKLFRSDSLFDKDEIFFGTTIEIAKDYSTSNSNTFINGILDNIVKYLKKENKIVKTGRGLIET